ncbi:unnamed protein product [Oppiella nova]|uniref:Zinc finger CCCH domain-containing protein 14 n=1 Tax=Oppiella nova TaxID=334625 RepID=A0A7R9QRX5_9ACAR|nr:unnamed protein product [Oppiella nova]CAG2172084.1 unnamed protein product [Oppiella nova]
MRRSTQVNHSVLGRPKRCFKWPNCVKGDQCQYHHPDRPCFSYPGCRFGNRCIYIHPLCTSGTSCSKKDCPYTHATGQKAQEIRTILVTHPVTSSSNVARTLAAKGTKSNTTQSNYCSRDTFIKFKKYDASK